MRARGVAGEERQRPVTDPLMLRTTHVYRMVLVLVQEAQVSEAVVLVRTVELELVGPLHMIQRLHLYCLVREVVEEIAAQVVTAVDSSA